MLYLQFKTTCKATFLRFITFPLCEGYIFGILRVELSCEKCFNKHSHVVDDYGLFVKKDKKFYARSQAVHSCLA